MRRGRPAGLGVTAGDGVTESRITGEHCHGAAELIGPIAHERLRRLRTGPQSLVGTQAHFMARVRQNCDQRHTLHGDDQADDQRKEAVAKAVHENHSNMRAGW